MLFYECGTVAESLTRVTHETLGLTPWPPPTKEHSTVYSSLNTSNEIQGRDLLVQWEWLLLSRPATFPHTGAERHSKSESTVTALGAS